MTVGEFDTFLQRFADDAEDLVTNLIPTVNDIVNELKAAAPVARKNGGSLKGSIKGVVQGDTAEIIMFDYGYYQNYGVSGKEDSLGISIPSGIFGTPGPFEFGTRRYGLKAQEWYDFETIKQRLIDAAQEALTNTNNE